MPSPLDRAAQVMDQLRSPGGCPWDAAQTHASLTSYLLEETYEVLEAIDSDDPVLLREELGDLLLQVLFHARLAQELPPGQSFGIDEVADDLVAKLVRRHPHVFGGAAIGSADALNEKWEQDKAREKGRTSAVDGVPLALPALALAAKLVARARRAGLEESGTAEVATGSLPEQSVQAQIGQRLFEVVREAQAEGVDPEAALRVVARRYREALVDAERAADGPA